MTSREYPLELLAHATRFQLSDDLSIEWRGPGDRWAIIRRSREVLARDGTWQYEPMPSSRDDAFIAATRYTLIAATQAVRERGLWTPSEGLPGSAS